MVCYGTRQAGVPNVAPWADHIANNIDIEARHLGQDEVLHAALI
jgi:hypothetical protein